MADATRAGGCGVGDCGVDGVEEESRSKVDIVTSTYTG